MKTDKIKFAIIGMGRMGITHYSIINSHPDVEIESIVDPSTVILSMMRKYLPVTTFKNHNDLFKTRAPDAILVCTPPHLNYEILKSAADIGAHVFVEKPFTTKKNKASELAFIFQQKQLVNQVGYVNRFNDVFRKLKYFLTIGGVGEVIRFKSEMFSCTITKEEDSYGWRSSRESGGGVVFEMAAHAIDLVNYLIGKPNKIVGTTMSKIFSSNVEDAITSTLLYTEGISGTLDINWSDKSYRKPTNKIEIFGKKGRVLADQHSLKIFLNEANPAEKLSQGWNTIYITDVFKPVQFYVRGNEFTSQLYHFIDCIKDKKKPNICSFNDAKDTLEVIEAIFEDYELNGKY